MAVKRAAYEDGMSRNKWLATLIRQALAAREGQTDAVAISKPSPEPSSPRRDGVTRELLRDRANEQLVELPVGKPRSELRDDRRPAFFQARK